MKLNDWVLGVSYILIYTPHSSKHEQHLATSTSMPDHEKDRFLNDLVGRGAEELIVETRKEVGEFSIVQLSHSIVRK